MRNHRRSFVVLAVFAVAAAVWAVQDAPILVVDGKTVSSNLKQTDGTLMVPVRDLASAMGYEVRESTGRVELVRLGSTAFSTSGMAPQTFGDISAPRPKASLSAVAGDEIAYGAFSHRLISVTYPGREYRQEFDSRRRKLRAPFGEEQLVVLRMSVTNRGKEAAYAPTPSTFGASVFDDAKVGYPITGVDARQASGVQTDDSLYASSSSSLGSVLIAPGGTLEYALVASLPKSSKVNQVVLNLPTSPLETSTSGATVTIDAPAP